MLIRALITTIVIFAIPPVSFPQVLILLSTGPTSVIVLAGGLAQVAFFSAGVLIVMVLVREALIRVIFSWLVRHLGESGGISAATS